MLKEEVDEEDIAEVVAKWTGIPVSKLMEGEVQKLLQMEDAAARAGHRPGRGRHRGGQRHPPRPRRAAGPATVRSAASCSSARPASARPSWRARWPSSCSTTSRRWSASTCPSTRRSTRVSRMIGAPPGYVGYDEAGQLTEAVRRRPYSVVLLRRGREGAPRGAQRAAAAARRRAPDRRQGPHGRLPQHGRDHDVEPRQPALAASVGRDAGIDEGTRREVMDAVREHFRPEFLNRIDEIIIFHPLGREHMGADRRHPARAAAQAAGRAEDHRRPHRRGTGAAGRGRVRSGLRRAAAEADDPAAACWIRWR